MTRGDLAELEGLLSGASAVVAMVDVHRGATGADVIGMRHDVDDNAGALDTAVRIAAWEADRGYRATFFLLHTAGYWQRDDFPACVAAIAGAGHEIGIHANAIPAALDNCAAPAEILAAALGQLRGLGHKVVGVAPHGDERCYRPDGTILFVNDELFSECGRPELGAPDRELAPGFRLEPRPLAWFGLEYETYRLPKRRYLSDSGGEWSVPPGSLAGGDGQLHVLWHPDWWAEVFA